MPELPEVETTRRGLLPHLKQQCIEQVNIHQYQLRWPIPKNLPSLIRGHEIKDLTRRGKYLLLHLDPGTVIIHLGMSGHCQLFPSKQAYRKHDHVELLLSSQRSLRYHDPRRFGAWLWTEDSPNEHPLLKPLGPEPLTEAFNADYLKMSLAKRNANIKSCLMNSRIVVGVGNIYTNEALFLAGIRPTRRANRISRPKLSQLVSCIQEVLSNAIAQGGTTLKDFTQSDGKPGYFKQSLMVYGRSNQPCLHCNTLLKEIRLAQRSTVYCPSCQH